MLLLRPHHSWITTMPGCGPGPAGMLRYAFVPFRSITWPLRFCGALVGGSCSALNCSSESGPVWAGLFSGVFGSGFLDGVDEEHAARAAITRAVRMPASYHSSAQRTIRRARNQQRGQQRRDEHDAAVNQPDVPAVCDAAVQMEHEATEASTARAECRCDPARTNRERAAQEQCADDDGHERGREPELEATVAAPEMLEAVVEAVLAAGMDHQAKRDECDRCDARADRRDRPARRHRAGLGHEREVAGHDKASEPRDTRADDPRD